MTVRNLDALFRPRSVALIGASARPGTIGALVARNLRDGGFDGPIGLVNPKGGTVAGLDCATDAAALPFVPELAVIATPPATVPDLVASLAARGTRGAVVITAGFGEGGSAEGAALRQRMLDAARPTLTRIVGPNCLGIMAPGHGLNASFVHVPPARGKVAFVAQSGAMVTAIVDWAAGRGIGFSHLASLGDMADVDFGDMLDYLAADPGTDSVLLYVEAVTSARKFMSAARACARLKPVIVIKAGRHAESARAAASHTGALAGSDAVYGAAFRRAGMLRVGDLGELFDAAETLSASPRIQGDRLAILTNGGGIGILATDDLLDLRGHLAALSPETLARLDAVLPATWSRANPVDIIGDAPARRYADALGALLTEPEADAVLVLNCPTAVTKGADAANAVIGAAEQRRVPILTCWVGEAGAAEARRLFASHGIPTYATPRAAVQGFMHMVAHRRGQEELLQAPPAEPPGPAPDRTAAAAAIAIAMAEKREWLTEPEAKTVLKAYGIPAAETGRARDADEAARLAERIGGPCAVKILSRDITHKTDVGGVALDLAGPESVREAAAAMLKRVAAARPEARIDGVTVQPMIRRPGAVELILGMTVDSLFGPVILFGHGGTAVEIIDDKALALPPLNDALARALMAETRVSRLLGSIRGKPAADAGGVARALVAVSQLAIDFGEIAELDINPLLADARGVLALDARIRVAPSARKGADRLAIRPYPAELEGEARLADGRTLLLRPVRPGDAPALQAAFDRLSPGTVRMRFFAQLRALPAELARRLAQIDYDRDMMLVAFDVARPEDGILGFAQAASDPDNERAEYAIVVQDAMARRGVGEILMRHLIDYARGHGTGLLWGDVLAENRAMLALAAKLGFARAASPEGRELVRTTLDLRG
ncbi:MAG: bifunctional acetate--CoA ligase family protein/GNAT family N-acetyltransferase [Alphaproteobacteria bacterium]